MRILRLSLLLPLFLLLPAASGEDKKPEKKEPPKVCVVIPLGVPPAATTKVTIRGLKLDAASEIRFSNEKATAKILKKEKNAPPNKQEPARVGDTIIDAEITLTAGLTDATLPFVVATPEGDTEAHQLLVNGDVPVIAEKEPNNGFKQAQPVQIPQAIDGAISQPQDLDVFRFEGQAGQKLVCEVLAARHGSALDSSLTLYNAAGRIVASNDDHAGSADSRIEVTLPETGVYYLSLADANDQGGSAHVYRLLITAVK